MLTKELVQATVRNGKLFPKFIKSDDAQALLEAKKICEVFVDAKGRIVQELEDEIKATASTPRAKAFAKLLFDQCEIAEASDEIMDLRWKVFASSERRRSSMAEGCQQSIEEFTALVAADVGLGVSELKHLLFSDLASARTVEQFETLSSEQLIAKYNLSHVSTFLCFANEVSMTVGGLSLAQKRELMRKLKFHRLMSDVEIDRDSNTITLELSGPLQLFGKSQGYALRIANFFLFVASLPEWKVDSLLQWKGKKVLFQVDQKSGVKSQSQRSHGGYVPKEFDLIVGALNEVEGYSAEMGADFVHIGKQSYCFPDFIVKSAKKQFAVELFHPWHKSQLVQRIKAADAAKSKELFIGVERSLLKDAEVKSFCENSQWYAQFGFEYSQFPTPTVIKRQVAKHV